jgi:ABC-type transport system involved in multi-copper enzyme maturation permease subunit
MTLSAAMNVLRWLVWDTFRQALAGRIFWVMLTISAVAVLFCASVGVRGGNVERLPNEITEFIPRDSQIDPEVKKRSGVFEVEGDLTLAFGAIRVPHARASDDSVHFLQLILSTGVAGTLGILLTLVWTSGFVPAFLEPQAASVLLTKPAPRWLLLLGKFIGLVALVGLQSGLFVGGTWMALGFGTGVWTEAYLRAVPLLMIQFAFFCSVSIFLAVVSRSTFVCIVGSVVFWLICTAVNMARIEMVLQSDSPALFRWLAEIGYWVLPKPVDFNLMMSHALHAENYFSPWSAGKQFEAQGLANPILSIITSLAFAGVTLLVSALDVRKTDY